METPLELFSLSWGVYPRRVLIYLAEKGLLKSPLIKFTEVTVSQEGKLTAPGKPAGSVPVLRLPDGTFIKQSIAILEYFEEICQNPTEPWQVELSKTAKNDSMLGQTAQEKARVREILSLADEVTSQFGFACHKGTALFKMLEETHPVTAKLVLEFCQKNLKLIERYYVDDPRFSSDDGQVTVADCVLYSVLHFAKDLYALDLLADPELASLQAFYKWFGERKSVQVADDHFPQEIKELASQWLPLE
jgi:glutathione S-transferase